MIKFLETLFSTIRQRIKSPFFGSFVFSWIIINWKPISYFIYSKDNMSYKISAIETSYENLGNAFWRPLILSLIYVIISPYVNQWINKLTSKAAKNKREKEHELKKDQIDNAHDLALKEKELENIRSGNRDTSRLNEEIIRLSVETDNLKETIQNKDETIGDYDVQLNDVTTKYQNLSKRISKERALQLEKDLSIARMDYMKYRSSFKENIDLVLTAIENKKNLAQVLPESVYKDFIDSSFIIKKDGIDNVYELTEEGEKLKRVHLEYIKIKNK